MLGLAGLFILGLVLFRTAQLARWRTNPPPANAAPRGLAPRFDLADHHRQVVKFERFLGRDPVVLLFLDPDLPVLADPLLGLLADCATKLSDAGIAILAVSEATPFAYQQAVQTRGSDVPFPLLTDLSVRPDVVANSPVHRLWGRYDPASNRPRGGLFLIARDGTVALGPDGFPLPVQDPAGTVADLCTGNWPRDLGWFPGKER